MINIVNPSSTIEIQTALNKLLIIWNTELAATYAKFTQQDVLQQTLVSAQGTASFSIRKATAVNILAAETAILAQLNAKYQPDYTTLLNMLYAAQTNTSGPATLQNTPDAVSTVPAAESVYNPTVSLI